MTDSNGTESNGGEERVSPNVNFLENKRCPTCGSNGPFEVVALVRVLIHDNGTDDAEDGSVEYDDDSPAMCYLCRREGKFGDFGIDD